MSNGLAVIIHGGAGKLKRENASKKLPVMQQAVEGAWLALKQGKPGEFAVVQALRAMEESEYFNAGYGGYPNLNGVVLLDVGLMRGNLDYVSIVNARRIKYPSEIALEMLKDNKTLMTTWTHELMTELDDAADFIKERYGHVQTHQELLSPYVEELLKDPQAAEVAKIEKMGTVGCVVRDANGKVYAGTSTGGVSAKENGRIGDTPVIGSGVYADDEVGGFSTTGHGESFLRTLVTGHVISQMRSSLRSDPALFSKDTNALKKLVDLEMDELVRRAQGRGAMIVIPVKGDPVYSYNSEMLSVATRFEDDRGDEKSDCRIACAKDSDISL